MKSIILFFVIILLVSCNGSRNKGVQNIPFDSLAHDYYCSIDVKKQFVINDDKTYREVWDMVYKDLDQMPRVPDVDFKKYTVIAVFMGTKPSGGFDIKIDKVSLRDDKITVNVTEISPGVSCVTTDAITKPYDFVTISKAAVEAEFKFSTVTKDCQ